MSSYTTNLNLLKKDPEADGNDYFNIQTMLNDNWDKIDAGKKLQDDAIAAHKAETAAHGAASAATASKIIVRDANGRAKVAAPSTADDIARKDTVDAVQTNLTTHMTETATTSVKGHVKLGAVAGTAAEGNHSHSISDISGTVPVLQGGTGQTTLASARNALGLGNTTGALPVANGGTGATTAAAALTALGITATATEINYIDGVTSAIQTQLDSKLGLAGGTMSGEVNYADNLVTRAYLKDYAEVLGTTPATTGTVNFDLTTGNTFNLTPTGNCTIGITNPPTSGRVGSFTLQINMSATLYAMTFPSSFKWDNDTPPTFTAGKTATISGYTIDGGTKYRVSCMGANFTT